MARKHTALAALVLIAGCAAPGRAVQRAEPLTVEPAPEETVRLNVQNDDFSDARLFAVGIGSRRPLGVVAGKEVAVVDVPWDFSQPLRVEIDMLAGPKCTTRTVQADPGDSFDLRIHPTLFTSSHCF